jgi:UPF0271 protein
VKIDLNADLGEGMDDAAILPFLTSANVACGLHAGGPEVMDRTVALALEKGVRVGAHPGYADRANFGRTDQQLAERDLRALILYQLGAIDAIVRARRGRLSHVKTHGAMYNRAARDRDLARAIAETVRDFDRNLVLVGLAGSFQIEAARSAGLNAAGEAFADRRYLPDGSLMPRSQTGAVLHDPAEAAAQALRIVQEKAVIAAGGTRLSIDAQTLCMHGDTQGAAEIARAVRKTLESAGVAIAPLDGTVRE